MTAYDREIVEIFREYKVNHIIVANKVDNLPMGQKEKQLQYIQGDSENSEVIPYSSKKHDRSNELMKRIASYLV